MTIEHNDDAFGESTLLDYGHALPIGVVETSPPRLEKTFAFRPYRTRDEKRIEKSRSKKGHPAQDVVTVLSEMLTHWGPYVWEELDDAKKKSILRNSFMCDVLYAYVALRVEALGETLALQTTCAACDHEWEWKADLRSVEIVTADRVEALSRTFDLRHPVSLGGRTFARLGLQPPTWGAVLAIREEKRRAGVGAVKIAMATGAIRYLIGDDGETLPAAASTLDELSKIDLERLVSEIDTVFPKVDISLEMVCPSCEHSQTYPLQWAFDFFFGGSSLPSGT